MTCTHPPTLPLEAGQALPCFARKVAYCIVNQHVSPSLRSREGARGRVRVNIWGMGTCYLIRIHINRNPHRACPFFLFKFFNRINYQLPGLCRRFFLFDLEKDCLYIPELNP